jgi:hypothetical protein
MLTNYELTKEISTVFFVSRIFYKNTHRSKMEIPGNFFFFLVFNPTLLLCETKSCKIGNNNDEGCDFIPISDWQ